MSANPVTWFEIYVKDAQTAKAFYEKTLSVKLEKLDTPRRGGG
jgi:predicted enzyme related to lactoylglutathione lyase